MAQIFCSLVHGYRVTNKEREQIMGSEHFNRAVTIECCGKKKKSSKQESIMDSQFYA